MTKACYGRLLGSVIIVVAMGLSVSCARLGPGKHEAHSDPTQLRDDVVVRKLTDGVWLFTTYFDLPKYPHCPANGLAVIDDSDAVLINLPWTNEQTAVIFDWVRRQHAVVKTVIPTHWHQDCAGGLEEAHRRGAGSLTLDKTAELLAKTGRPAPRATFNRSVALQSGRLRIELAYLGAGHTVDNIVAWLPRSRVLFGGCLVKGQSATDLGNTEDADLTAYPQTLRRLAAAYPRARMVVPGHGAPGGVELISHSIALCERAHRIGDAIGDQLGFVTSAIRSGGRYSSRNVLTSLGRSRLATAES